jgi:hypothetical protein
MRLLVIGIAVIFGLISTAPNFQGAQFLKLPEFIQHYSEHQSGPESFSCFLAFVKEHYFNNDRFWNRYGCALIIGLPQGS